MTKTVQECLAIIGVASDDLEGCESLQDEFKTIKKIYFRKILQTHPDKGGDPEVFRDVQTSFEVLRELFQKESLSTFLGNLDQTVPDYDDLYEDFDTSRTPSWEYYQEAAEEEVPLYRVELAKSSRGKCYQKSKTGKKCPEDSCIPKGEIRVGVLDENSGSYSRWVHLDCWRVPSRIWLGLSGMEFFSMPSREKAINDNNILEALERMEQVVLCGFSELSQDDKLLFLEHVMNQTNHARFVKRKKKETPSGEHKKPAAATSEEASKPAAASSVATTSSSRAVTTTKRGFVVPKPGVNGGIPGVFNGKCCVLTGVFPEIGGGAGLSQGKDRVKAMIQDFGGRVTGSVSGKTDLLVVGKAPGASKVSQARARGIQLIGLHELKNICEGTTATLDDAEPAVITNFSAGYSGNGKALTWSAATLKDLRTPGNNTAVEAAYVPSNKKAATKQTKSKTKVSESSTDTTLDVNVKPPPVQKKRKARTTKKVSESTDTLDVNVNKPPAQKKRKTRATKNQKHLLETINGLKQKELKELCKQHGLGVSGTKAVLKKRLEEYVTVE